MKSIVLYSSFTGRTKAVAEAVASGLPQGTPCVSVEHIPDDIDSYDCVFFGCWVHDGVADEGSQQVLGKLHNKHIAVFATMAEDPFSDEASKSLHNAIEILPPGSRVDGTYITIVQSKEHFMDMITEAPHDMDLSGARLFAENTFSRILAA